MSDQHYVIDLVLRYQQEPKMKFLYFWGHTPKQPTEIDKSCLSQWYPATFIVDGIEYVTAEHYMMAQKAKLFGDEITFEKILQVEHPHDAKKLGRQVERYDETTWQQQRFNIVVEGNEAKFPQHQNLKDFLLNTQQRVLVEASPVDKIWGIGLAQDHLAATNPQNWQGLNLLGFALMEVRQRLQQQIQAES